MSVRQKWVIGFAISIGILFAYTLISTLILGDKGHSGDDWVAVSFPFFYPLPQAFTEGAMAIRRPTSTTYFALLLKIVQYNDKLIFFASLQLLLMANVLMGIALLRAFPGRYTMVIVAMLVGMFAPMVAPLTYRLSLDNTRLASLFYWLSVVLFQHEATKPQRGTLSALPILAYMIGLLSYESILMLPVVTFLLVLPVYWRNNQDEAGHYHLTLFTQLIVAHLISYAGFFYIRSVYSVEIPFDTTQVDYLSIAVGYASNLVKSIWHPFVQLLQYRDVLSLLIGLLMAVVVWWALRMTHDVAPNERRFHSGHYIVLVAVLFIVLGTLPFVLFGIPADIRFPHHSRGYAASAFGIAILMGYGVSVAQRWRIVPIVFAVWVGCMAANHASIRIGWQQANETREQLHASLREVVPDVMDDTMILYINYDLFNEYNVPVQQGMIVDVYTHLFYQNQRLKGVRLLEIPSQFPPIVYDDAIEMPGQRVPLDQVIILERVGTGYRIVDEIALDDPWHIEWRGSATAITTNRERILPDARPDNRFDRLFGNPQ